MVIPEQPREISPVPAHGRHRHAAHAAFTDNWLPATAPPGTRQDMLSKLAAARQMLKDGGISWLSRPQNPTRDAGPCC